VQSDLSQQTVLNSDSDKSSVIRVNKTVGQIPSTDEFWVVLQSTVTKTKHENGNKKRNQKQQNMDEIEMISYDDYNKNW